MLIDLIKENRSYRSFDESVAVGTKTLLELVDSARYAPSSVNLQPFKYLLINDERKEIVFPLLGWAKLLPNFVGPAEGKRPMAYIIICTDRNIAPNTDRYLTDVGIVAQTIMLAAVERGLGGCMIGNYNKNTFLNALNLPENLYPSLVLAIGKPHDDEKIEIVEINSEMNTMDTKYFRKNGIHYVPKRKLNSIIL